VQRFVEDEDCYLRWLAEHPDLFVLNTARPPTPDYLVLHRANCHTMSGTPARGSRWTGDYVKTCGSRPDLEQYTREVGG